MRTDYNISKTCVVNCLCKAHVGTDSLDGDKYPIRIATNMESRRSVSLAASRKHHLVNDKSNLEPLDYPWEPTLLQ